MEKPYLIYNTGKACLTCMVGLFVVIPLAAWLMSAVEVGSSQLLPAVCAILAGLSVLMGFYVDRRARR